MKYIFQNLKLRKLYIFFLFLAVLNIFFSTGNSHAKTFSINDLELSTPFKINFNKNKIIDEGFVQAFNQLMLSIVQSNDRQKLKKIPLNQIKSMIETFSIKEEKFIQKTYNLNLGVSFNKKKIFKYLSSKNIFPTQIFREKFLFIPVIIDQFNTDLLVFSNNPIYKNWKKVDKKSFLIEYILPTEDLEDFNLIKKNYSELENYNFDEIIKKYFLNHSIIALIFKDDNQIKVLSKINIKDKKVIKSNSFKNIDLNNEENLISLINNLKNIYEDFWKDHNLINSSIKLPLSIKIDNKNFDLTTEFEKTLDKIDLISSYSITKLNQNFIFYEIIFNGTPKNFIHIMNKNDYSFDTQKKIWILK